MNRRDFLKGLAIGAAALLGLKAPKQTVRTGELKWKEAPADITWTAGSGVLCFYNHNTETWETLTNDFHFKRSRNG